MNFGHPDSPVHFSKLLTICKGIQQRLVGRGYMYSPQFFHINSNFFLVNYPISFLSYIPLLLFPFSFSFPFLFPLSVSFPSSNLPLFLFFPSLSSLFFPSVLGWPSCWTPSQGYCASFPWELLWPLSPLCHCICSVSFAPYRKHQWLWGNFSYFCDTFWVTLSTESLKLMTTMLISWWEKVQRRSLLLQ